MICQLVNVVQNFTFYIINKIKSLLFGHVFHMGLVSTTVLSMLLAQQQILELQDQCEPKSRLYQGCRSCMELA